MKVPIATIAFSLLILNSTPGITAPPADLLGQFLFFEEGPDDFLLFDDATTGEERDLLGDIDPFTYTYTVTGPTTAEFVATYEPGDYDEWDLVYDGPGTGTYVRREYDENTLDDTDTGRFSENSGSSTPPVTLAGIRLEEAVELEDERFEFLTETDGREFEPGDVDPFTYVYEVTDPNTATLVATYKIDKADNLTLTFETDTTGTYVMDRFDDGVLDDQKRGQFRLSINTQTVDVAIGKTAARLRGDDFFNPAGRQQTEEVKLTGTRPVKIETGIENDGDVDDIEVRAGKVSKKLEVRYFTVNPRRNVTSDLARGGLDLGTLDHQESERIEIEIRSRRSGKTKGKGFVEGSSSEIEGARDRVNFNVSAK